MLLWIWIFGGLLISEQKSGIAKFTLDIDR